MTGVGVDVVIRQLRAVRSEAFNGPPQRWSYFTDNAPDAGWLGTLEKISAAEASRPVGGTTIAAHVFHAAFALEASTEWIRDDRKPRNWRESWTVSEVDDSR
ncbi:MAG: hypothetical protein ACRDF6_06660, partial [bacterium]